MKLLIASHNQGKLKELKALLEPMNIGVISAEELGINLAVKELGDSYSDNAASKAIAYARATGMVALGDDSGLEVALLNGAPGLYSARYSPKPAASDADRRVYLLDNLRSYPRPWLARFCCTVAIANPDGEVWFSVGYCPGEVIPEERGQNGFGYDPIFLVENLGRTMAELSFEEKNQLSHRARAVKAISSRLLDLLSIE